jgi:DNA-binding NtrC family response regulator
LLEIKAHSDFISGSSYKMKEIMKWVERVARIDAPLLIEGEKGTGKNALAREIHLRSHRRQAPLKILPASALTAEALMQELSTKGDGPCLFERVNGGTVVIEEVGSLPLRVQQVLETWISWQQASRLSGEPMPDFRLICTSSESLEAMVESGRFREELFYRLSVSTIMLPPLRMRREDIDSIAEHVLSRVGKIHQLEVKSIENAALVLLRNFSWPGNVTELENAIERAALASTDEAVRVADLPSKLFQRVAPNPQPDAIDESLPIGATLDEYSRRVERHFILETLKFNEGSREKTAAMLGISVATLYRKMGYKEEGQ